MKKSYLSYFNFYLLLPYRFRREGYVRRSLKVLDSNLEVYEYGNMQSLRKMFNNNKEEEKNDNYSVVIINLP